MTAPELDHAIDVTIDSGNSAERPCSHWYESVLGKVRIESNAWLTHLLDLADETGPLAQPAAAYRLHVQGEPIDTMITQRSTLRDDLATAGRSTILEVAGRLAAAGSGYPIVARIVNPSRIVVEWAPSTAGCRHMTARRLGFREHVRDCSAMIGDQAPSQTAEVVIRHEQRVDRISAAGHSCSNTDVAAWVTGFLGETRMQRNDTDILCRGVCQWFGEYDDDDIRRLILWGWLHERAPLSPTLSEVNVRYHNRVIGATIPRTREDRAITWCTTNFPESLSSAIDALPVDVAAVQAMFTTIRDGMINVLSRHEELTPRDAAVIADRLQQIHVRIASLAKPARLPEPWQTDNDRHEPKAFSLLDLIEATRRRTPPAGRPRATWAQIYIHHSEDTLVIGRAAAHSTHLLRAGEPLYCFARMGFVIAHELGHIVAASEAPGVQRWLRHLRAFYSTVVIHTSNGDLVPLDADATLRENAADVLGLAAAAVAVQKWAIESGGDPDDAQQRFLAHWRGFWETTLPPHIVRLRARGGPHALPAVRRDVTPRLVVSEAGTSLSDTPVAPAYSAATVPGPGRYV